MVESAGLVAAVVSNPVYYTCEHSNVLLVAPSAAPIIPTLFPMSTAPSEVWNDMLKDNAGKDDPLWMYLTMDEWDMFSYVLVISCYLHDELAAYHQIEHSSSPS